MPESKIYIRGSSGKPVNFNQKRIIATGYDGVDDKVYGIYKGSTHVWAPSRFYVIYKNVNTSTKNVLKDTFSVPDWCQCVYYLIIGGGGAGSYGDGGLNKGGVRGNLAGSRSGISSPLKVATPYNSSGRKIYVELGTGGVNYSTSSSSSGGASKIMGCGINAEVSGASSPIGEFTNNSTPGSWSSVHTTLGTIRDSSGALMNPLSLSPGTKIYHSEYFSEPTPGKGGDGGEGGTFGRYELGKPGQGGGVIVWGLSGDESPTG